jgi:ribosomal protein S25
MKKQTSNDTTTIIPIRVPDILDDVPERIIDQNSITMEQIMDRMKVLVSQAGKFAREKVQAGDWQRCWKNVDGKLMPAWRRAKK